MSQTTARKDGAMYGPNARQTGEHAKGPAGLFASSLYASFRHLMSERGIWTDVRSAVLRRDPTAIEWIDVAAANDWIPIERHILVMEGLADVLGDEGLRDLGERRFEMAIEAGVLAPIFRAWMRSFAPIEEVLRVVPHAWSAVTRNLGRVTILERGERRMVLRTQEVPRALYEAHGWGRFLEGYGRGLVRTGGREGECVLTQASDALAIDATFTWR